MPIQHQSLAQSFHCKLVAGLSRQSFLYALFYTLIVLGAYYQIDYIIQFNPVDHIWSDAQRHWEQGSDSLRNDPMSMTDPVFYQLYIGALAKLTFQDSALVAFYTCLLALFTPWVWYRFMRELQPNKLLATAGWAGLSILPSWMAIYGYFMQETLLLPMLGASLYASWRCKRKQDVASFVVMVTIWILAGLTRGIAIPMAAVACTWLWLVQDEKIKKAVYSLLVIGLIMGPLTYRAYKTMNIFAPHGIGHLVSIYTHSGNKEININYTREGASWGYWFGSPSTGEKPFEPLSDWKTARTGTVRATINIDKGKEDWDTALAANPLTLDNYFWLTKENLIFLFFGSSWPDNNMDRQVDRLNHYSRWLWAPLTLISLVWTIFYWRRLKGNRMLPCIILAWLLVQAIIPISVNEGRYRKPLEGLLFAQFALLLAVRRGHKDDYQEDDSGAPQFAAVLPLTLLGLAIHTAANSTYTIINSNASFDNNGRAYLNNINPLSHQQGWGTLGINQNLEQGSISIYGTPYQQGIAVHADSETTYRIPSGAKFFHSFYGLDDQGRQGLVEFRILLDGKEAFNSGQVRYAKAGEIMLPLTGANEITLIVDSLGSKDHDHADWAEAFFLHADHSAATLTPEQPSAPTSTGPKHD